MNTKLFKFSISLVELDGETFLEKSLVVGKVLVIGSTEKHRVCFA